uniref:Peptidase A1 domain-containing protein n=1 Tax=Aegilops tauschii subsp. strangulata TaxID=200361 RepID=A0A453PF20_AEGTS
MAFVSQLLLLLSCIICHALIASAAGEQSYKILSTSSLKPQAVCSEPKVNPSSSSGATVPLNHRHGPCSPAPSKKEPTFEELLRRDQLRAGYVQRKFSTNHRGGGLQQSEELKVPTELGSSLDTLDAPACTQLGAEANACSNSQCQYMVRYGDGSNTTGTYGSDTLELGSDTVKEFQFGCSRVEEGFGDKTDGLMGLGGDAQSLISQTAATYGRAFSYCLPPSPGSKGFLTLGAQTGTTGFATTGMLRSEQAPTFYGVLLQGIKVGGEQLSVAPSVFSAGSVMDSGTIITRLPPTAYTALKTAFKDGMKQYPAAPSRSILDTCFDFSGQDNVTIPTVALMFDGGAVVDLDANGIIFGSCLAFTGTDDDESTGIIGNVQQRTLEVLYDAGQSSRDVFANRSRTSPICLFGFVSGTVITWLPRRAYSALSSAFRSGMRRYPRAAPVGILDTCYDFTGLSNVSVPTVELVFDGGAVMDLDSDGIMIEHCLAFAPTSDESFIGNVQQRTFEVLHDVGQGIFGFRSGTC